MPPIKWREQDVDLLRKQIRNFNRKIDRLMKAGAPEVKAALPPKMSMKTARAQIETRADYNRMLKSIGRVTARGSEKLVTTKGGVTAPEFEIKELQARVRFINAQRKKRLAKLPEIEPGDLPMMGRVTREQLKPKTAPGKIVPSGWEKYKESVYKQSSPEYYKTGDARYVQNYIKGIEENFSKKDADAIKQMIKDNYTDEEFVMTSLENEELSISFQYDPIAKAVKRKAIYEELYRKIKNVESFNEKDFTKFLNKYGVK